MRNWKEIYNELEHESFRLKKEQRQALTEGDWDLLNTQINDIYLELEEIKNLLNKLVGGENV